MFALSTGEKDCHDMADTGLEPAGVAGRLISLWTVSSVVSDQRDSERVDVDEGRLA